MMQQEIIFTRIQEIIRCVLKNDSIILSNETTSNDVDGWDSLTHMLIITEVEKQFNVRINFRELMKISNVGELVQTIEKKMK